MLVRSAVALAGLVALASPAHSDVTVGPPGSGAVFDDLQAAIDAVGPGETVFVLPGSYAGSIQIPAGVAVVGSGSDQTRLLGAAQAPHATIANVPLGQQARLVGVGLATIPGGGGVEAFPSGLVIDACAGGITVADVTYAPSTAGVTPDGLDIPALLTATDSDQVLLQGVVMDASLLVQPSGGTATIGLSAQNSRIYALESDFVGGTQLGGDGAPGVLLESSTMWFTGTTALGGPAAVLETDDPVPSPLAGPGVALQNGSRVELFGGFGNLAAGGEGGGVLDATGTIPVIVGSGAPALVHTNGSSTVLAAGSSLAGGSAIDGSSQAPPSVDDGTGGLLFFLEGNLGLRADKTLISSAGEVVTLEIRGNSNALAGTFFGLDPVDQYTVPPLFGDIQINPFVPSILPPVNTGFSGQTSLPIPIPPLPPGLTVYLQTIDLGFSFAPSASQPLFLQIVP